MDTQNNQQHIKQERLEKLDSFDEKRIVNFIKANKNKSPEPLAR